MEGEADVHARLGRQGRRRPLTPEEAALAAALEDIFACGEHDFAAVARRLGERQVVRPSGAIDPWSEAALRRELELINGSLDGAYAAASIIAPYR